jgi:hypothetical protein
VEEMKSEAHAMNARVDAPAEMPMKILLFGYLI